MTKKSIQQIAFMEMRIASAVSSRRERRNGSKKLFLTADPSPAGILKGKMCRIALGGAVTA